MKITVFGAGSPTEQGILEAEELGKRIAKAGHILKNGGYAGTMKASARGCISAGGHTIGVCIEGHKIADEGKPNEFIREVIITKHLHERLRELLNTDILIVLKGGLGTLEEFFTAWAENAANDAEGTKPIPIYVVGKENKKLIDFLIKEQFVHQKHLRFIKCVNSIDDLDFLKNKN